MSDKMFHRKASRFVMILEYKNPCSLSFFTWWYFILLLMDLRGKIPYIGFLIPKMRKILKYLQLQGHFIKYINILFLWIVPSQTLVCLVYYDDDKGGKTSIASSEWKCSVAFGMSWCEDCEIFFSLLSLFSWFIIFICYTFSYKKHITYLCVKLWKYDFCSTIVDFLSIGAIICILWTSQWNSTCEAYKSLKSKW